jgi:hypothetical protein
MHTRNGDFTPHKTHSSSQALSWTDNTIHSFTVFNLLQVPLSFLCTFIDSFSQEQDSHLMHVYQNSVTHLPPGCDSAGLARRACANPSESALQMKRVKMSAPGAERLRSDITMPMRMKASPFGPHPFQPSKTAVHFSACSCRLKSM